MKILLVDDDEFILDLYSRALKLEHYEVLKAHDGMEAMAVLRRTEVQPDVIISDVVMPQMDGYYFLETLKADSKYKNIPFIFLTSLSSDANRQKGLNLGAIEYFVKSEHHPEDIIERLKKF